MAIVKYLPKKASARNPPKRDRMKEVPRKFVTIFADCALGRCMVFTKYVTKFTAMPKVANLSHSSIPSMKAAGSHPPVLVLSAGLPLKSKA